MAEGGLVPSGVRYGEGYPLFSPAESRGASWAPSAGSGAEPQPKTDFGVFWRAQNAHFCTYMTKSAGDNLQYRPPYSKFWGDVSPLSPRDLCPWEGVSILFHLFLSPLSLPFPLSFPVSKWPLKKNSNPHKRLGSAVPRPQTHILQKIKRNLYMQGCICQIYTGGVRVSTGYDWPSDYSGHGGCQIGKRHIVVHKYTGLGVGGC